MIVELSPLQISNFQKEHFIFYETTENVCSNRSSGVYSPSYPRPHDVTAIVGKQVVLHPPLHQGSARHCVADIFFVFSK